MLRGQKRRMKFNIVTTSQVDEVSQIRRNGIQYKFLYEYENVEDEL